MRTSRFRQPYYGVSYIGSRASVVARTSNPHLARMTCAPVRGLMQVRAKGGLGVRPHLRVRRESSRSGAYGLLVVMAMLAVLVATGVSPGTIILIGALLLCPLLVAACLAYAFMRAPSDRSGEHGNLRR